MNIVSKLLARFVCLVIPFGIASGSLVNAQEIDFNRQVKPILSDRCFVCHGPDDKAREAGLRLDLKEDLLEVAKTDSLDDNELWNRISSDDEDEIMPPLHSKLKLSPPEKDLIRKWIEQGAEWEQHWSFLRLAKKIELPESSGDWGQNEIDAFVLKRMREQGLKPQQRAQREKLIRRLTFDLNGVPPTIAEIDAFVHDKSAAAYEKLVDRLLASPRYGERMASIWLDVSRYSDTYGYQVDRDRYVWPWRDWVIRAYNKNMPYDQFIREQLAGDLIPNATDQQRLATTYNRLHPQKVEGGSDEEEFRVEYVADRAQTYSTGILGLTMECARCHDHKYDPLSQREYFQLFAFFDDIDEAGLYSYFTNSVPTPTLTLPNEAQRKKIKESKLAIAKLKKKLDEQFADCGSRFLTWLETKPNIELPKPIKYLDFESHQPAGANRSVDGKFGKAAMLSGDDGIAVGVGNFRRDQPFTVTFWMKVPDHKKRAVIFHRSRAWTDAASRGYELLIVDGKLQASLIHFWPGNAISVQSGKIPTDQWIHVAVTYAGTNRADDIRIFVDGQDTNATVIQDSLTKNITGGGGDNIVIGERFRDRGFTGGQIDEFKVYDKWFAPVMVLWQYDKAAAIKTRNSKDVQMQMEWWDYYVQYVDEEYAKRYSDFLAALKAKHDLENSLTEIMVMKESKTPKQAYILKRGEYNQRGEKVDPFIPNILADTKSPTQANWKDKRLPNRMDLANWTVQKDHPLTSRVAVNRVWQMLFGEGLVRTPEDFGSQGKPPSHPQLLDWLARDFVDNGWDTKRLIKKIVMSETYRLASTPTVDSLQKDPENIWLSHATRYQLSAEAIRDNVLSVSGLLTDKIGGPPAKPYEVTVSFKPTGRDRGANLYRRSLYTYWKRTGPAPVMMTLDASKRDVCRVKRQRTNSPLTALVLMNDPQVIEAARATSDKLMHENASDAKATIAAAFRLTTGRKATQTESQILLKLFQSTRERFVASPESTKKFLATGDYKAKYKLADADLAAMTLVITTLFSHDECIRKY